MMFSIIFGIIIGIVCATHRGSFIDQFLTVIMTAMNGIPVFWIGIMLMYLLGVQLKLLPLMGFFRARGRLWRLSETCGDANVYHDLRAAFLHSTASAHQHARSH
jgi:ABC-type dipeptide/oligopeptide/nickel transport system permease component